MFTLQTRIHVPGLKGAQVYDFLTHPTDEAYQAWWPGTHLHFHFVHRAVALVGSTLYMDEYIGRRRVKMTGRVCEAVPGKRLVWQSLALVPLPVRLVLNLDDDADGVLITHTLCIGYEGPGHVLDSFFRQFFPASFAEALDEHVRTEFPLLRDLLNRQKQTGQLEAGVELPGL